MILRTTRSGARTGFTLIEVLIVIAIMGLLLALSAAAYFRVKQGAVEGNTKITLQKVHSSLDRQMKAEIDNANDDFKDITKISNWVKSASSVDGQTVDSRRAKVIWAKLRLKTEFPQNFWEVVVWQDLAANTVGAPSLRKSTYLRELQKPGINATTVINPNLPLTPVQLEQLHLESAALLYLAISPSRRGEMSLSDDHVGSHAIMEVDLYGHKFKCYKDSWDRPIAFIRWPTGAADKDLNNDNSFIPRSTITGTQVAIDPQDPERTLQDQRWQQTPNKALFTSYIHPLSTAPANPLNLTPVVFSGGRDREFGIDQTYLTVAGGEDDNIYSYRVRGQGRQ